ncbi:WXG100 family type VII secretion target [Zhihengliuella sp. ISTPL4]|uniref:WXG100 family type VII secretion target n=1 Tax=Zhihengliuella sp. ISTPL4 TaxID=2058657 RepID=UPI000C79BC86|nr:hypothetical protein [Zhihengliuella sp. ISTPL4]
MPNWTRFDPGAGDLTACDRAKQWTDTQASDLADARSAVSTILRDLDDIWTGKSADAFRARVLEFHDRLEASEEAMRITGKGILAYADAVAEIARRAAPLKHRLEAAELILNGVHSEALFGADPEGLARRFDAEQQATIDAQDAADELARLADERMKADRTLAELLARTAAEGWGGLDCTASPSGKSPRELANGRVGELLDSFRTGRDGMRGVVLGAGDPFVDTLMHSDHINSARAEVLDALRRGDLRAAGEPLDLDRVISDNPWVLLQDGFNVVTSGIPVSPLQGQNLPESFLGSYALRVLAGDPQPDGGISVTYIINNDTTIDSATRIPGTGGAHLPIIGTAMTSAYAERGDFSPQHQTIVWTETVYP